jgi:hypothetical protein
MPQSTDHVYTMFAWLSAELLERIEREAGSVR